MSLGAVRLGMPRRESPPRPHSNPRKRGYCVEQYCQLMLKYKMLVRVGAYSRAHSLVRLVRELARLDRRVEVLFKPENAVMPTRIEDAYIGARYLPRRCLREGVEAMASEAGGTGEHACVGGPHPHPTKPVWRRGTRCRSPPC